MLLPDSTGLNSLINYDCIIDDTARRVHRPQDTIEQQEQSSGKKDHTVKNHRMIDIEERLVYSLRRTLAERIHDKRICDEEGSTFPPGCVLFQDTGFQGLEPAQVCPYQPKKKPRGQELSPDDKATHTMIASIRILIEPGIAGVERCRMVHDILRNTKTQCDDLVMEIACGLHNFRATLRYAVCERTLRPFYSG